jgi:hypothetical protein
LTEDEEDLVALLNDMEKCRDRLDVIATRIRLHVEEHPAVQALWDRFVQSGGVDADDLRDLIAHPLRPARSVPRRVLGLDYMGIWGKQGLLRLVRDNPRRKRFEKEAA